MRICEEPPPHKPPRRSKPRSTTSEPSRQNPPTTSRIAVFRGLKKARIIAVAAWPAMPRFTERISFYFFSDDQGKLTYWSRVS